MPDPELIIKILDTKGFPWLLAFGAILGALGISKKWIEEAIKTWAEGKRKKREFVLGAQLGIMIDVNSKIYDFEVAVAKFVSLFGEIRGEQRTQLGEVFIEKLHDLKQAFEPNRIYFPEKLADKIEKLSDSYRDCGRDFLIHVQMEGVPTDSDKWIAMNKFVSTEAPKIRREIETEIRKHML